MRPIRDFIIYCDRGSNTASELARRLNARRLYANPSRKLRSTSGSLCINYGTGHSPNFRLGDKSVVLNPPEAVSRAISKRVSHAAFITHSVPTLEFTTSRDKAAQWLQEGSGVLCRRDGLSGGNGITFVPKGSKSVPQTDFYTKYFAKTHEYRAHVVKGRMIDLTQKRLQNGAAKSEDADSVERIVRSLDNGWVHAHSFQLGSVQRAEIEKVAVAALDSLGLDFGAVDILAKYPKGDLSRSPILAVCEVNTAPGLANEVTLNAYVTSFKSIYTSTAIARNVPVIERPKRRRVKRMVKVWITTKKGNRVQRMRERWVYEPVQG
jgi:hypothetical protein